jgi:protocatechuate 3,4-dioxygenase beta subunit
MSKVIVAAAMIVIVGMASVFAAAPTTQQPLVLSGRVLDGDGKPIAGATVELAGPVFMNTRSDAQGNYAFNSSRASGEYRIGAKADGFITIEYYRNRESIQLSPQSPLKHDIVLQRGATVRVRVVDLLGMPIERANVDLTRPSDDYRDRNNERKSTDIAGRASFTVPASHDPYIVSASAAEQEPVHTNVTADAVDKPQEVELQLLPGTPVKGIAICNDGKPATGWSIVAYPEWWVSNYLPAGAKIDDKGNFTLTEAGRGKYNLWISMNRMSQQVTSVSFPPTSQPIRVDIPLPSPASRTQFSGKVRIIGARPDYISVEAMSLDGAREWFNEQVEFGGRPRRAASGPATALATGEGTFTFKEIPAGTYRISFNAPTIETKVLERVTIPGDLPVVELKAVGKTRLAGTVTDAASGKPLAQFGIRVQKLETIGNGPNYVQEGTWTQFNNAGGKFSIDLVGPGVYQVQASADGYAWLWSDKVRVENAGSVGNVALKLSKGGSLAGVVVDPAGKPVAGAKVIPLSMARTTAMRGEDRFEGEAGAVTTDPRGAFTINFLAPGDEQLKVVHQDFAPQVAKGFKITEGQKADAGTIKLTLGGTVEGTVYEETGKPAAAVTLNFQDASGYGGGGDERAGRVASAVSASDGKFRVEHLPEQTIYVSVSDGWRRGGMIRRTVRPLDGKTARLDFGGKTSLKGRLLAGSQPIAGSRVNLSIYNPHFGPVMCFARTDDQGRFTFFGMPAGRYTLYSESKNERGDWLNVKDVDVTGEPQDLGDVSADVGDVVATISGDADDLKAINYVNISTDLPKRLYQTHITALRKEGDRWRGSNVPVGKFRLEARGSDGIVFAKRFERNAGDKEVAVALQIPKRSAELTVNLTGVEGDGERSFVAIRNEDGSVHAYVGGTRAKTIKLPPGTYLAADESGDRPRAGARSVEVKPGAPATMQVDLSAAATEDGPMRVTLALWDSTGVFVAAQDVKLVNGSGKLAEQSGDGGIGPMFMAGPGSYDVIVEMPAAPPRKQKVDVSASDEGAKNTRWRVVNVVLR